MKILMKIFATRLANHMEDLIGDVQNSFIKGRQASEGIIIAKEVAHSIKVGRNQGIILKMDFEKSFNSVNWCFLYKVMLAMKFDQKWVKWIKALLESTRISVLVNGTPTKEFSPEKGLRKGDLIFLMLFNLVGEVLNIMLNKAYDEGLFKCFSLDKSAMDITHLQFADDIIIFLDGTIESIKSVKRVLQYFQILSGLKIN